MPRLRTALLLTAAALLLTVAAPSFAEEVLAQGSSWDKRTAKIQGDWKIVDRDGQLFLVLGDGFKTKRAPDLKAFLIPVPTTGVAKKDIPAGSLRIGLLESHKGGQELALPAGTSLDDYRSLAVHCEKFNKVWSVTSLR